VRLPVMTMTEHERGAAGPLILSAAVNVVASVLFISMLGLTGAAIATTIVLIVWNVATVFFICRHLRLLPGIVGMFGSTLRRSLDSRL
jgi:O-antigen/teichoic acid export membrane protein